jgi:ketosteroid isomerase-like protein
MKISRSAALLALASLTLASSTPAPVTKPLTGVAKEIANARGQWIQELRAKHLDLFLKLYTPDAVFLQPTSERVFGVAALRALFKKTMASVTSNPGLKSLDEEDSGDLAFDSGTYTETLTPTSGGAPQEIAGSYLTIYKRQPAGTSGNKWLIIEQSWTLTAPSASH